MRQLQECVTLSSSFKAFKPQKRHLNRIMFVLISSFLAFALLPLDLSDGTQKGQQVKLTIHLCETDNWISFFPNKRCKNVCRAVSVATVNIPERDRSLFWLLYGTAVTTPVGCRFVANQSMFTWK